MRPSSMATWPILAALLSGLASAQAPPRPGPAIDPEAVERETQPFRERIARALDDAKLPDAIAAARELLDLHRKRRGPGSPAAAETLGLLALLHEASGELALARSAIHDAAEIRAGTLGESHAMAVDDRR